jgi:prophage regulatory protein
VSEEQIEQILRFPRVSAMTGKSRAQLYLDIKAGTFPPARQLGPRSIGWFASEVQDWIKSRPVADPSAQFIGKLSKQRFPKGDAA